MTDEEITQSLTNAMRLLNKTLSQLELVCDSIDEEGCPVCACGKAITETDLRTVEEARTFLIEKSRDPDRDERIVAATKCIGIAMTLVSKAYSMRMLADAAHNGFESIAEARVQHIISGPEGQNIKEALEKALSEDGLTRHIDPTKVN